MKPFWLILLFIFLFSCKKDELDPSEEIFEAKISEHIIGPQGGFINSDSIHIYIPAGSFDSEHKLELWLTEDPTASQTRVSSSYLLKGIPYNFKTPFKIGIFYTGDLGGKSFLAAGYSQVKEDIPNEELIFDFLPASDSVNYLWGEFQAIRMENGNTKKAKISESSGFELFIWAISFMATYETDFAKIGYPGTLDLNKIKHLGDRIDSAAKYFTSRGLINKYLGKLNIAIFSLGEDVPIKYHNLHRNNILFIQPNELLNRGLHLHKHIFMNIDANKFNTYDENYIRMIAGESIYRFVHSIYLGVPDNWLEWGLIYRFKNFFIKNTDIWEDLYFKPEFYEQPFIGLVTGINSLSETWDHPNVSSVEKGHGIAMTPLLEYLFSVYDSDKQLLKTIFKNRVSDQMIPLDNLLNSVPADIDVWWPGFFYKFLTGKILPSAPPMCIENIHSTNEFYFMDESDTVKYFQETYYPISGGICRLNFSPDAFREGESLRFRYTALPASTMVNFLIFSEQDGELEFLIEGNDIAISDVKSLVEKGVSGLVVLVVNNTIPENMFFRYPENVFARYIITLEIRKETDKTIEWPWKYVNINFENLTAIYEWDNGDEFESPASFGHHVQNCIFSAGESAFYSSWDTSYTNGITGYNKKVDLFIKVDTLRLDVISFEASNMVEYFYDNNLETRQESSITGGKVPASYNDADYLTNQIDGTGSCSAIHSFEHTYTEKPGTSYEKTRVLTSFDCTQDSYLRISWKKDKLVW